MKFRVAFLAMLAASTTPVQAKWYEASSEHFVIYADDSENDVRRFAENLEKYHSAISLLTNREVEVPSPSNRVTIFAVGDQSDIRELEGSGRSEVAGFYVPRAGASRAFVQNIRHRRGYPDFSTVVLLHEYAHHFLISSSAYAMPRWLSEGAAEFFASATFNSDGSVQIGRPANHRAGELAYARDVKVEELLDAELYEKRHGNRFDSFYGKSWALYHYLVFSEQRKGQFGAYWQYLRQGIDPVEAANRSFGDLDALDRELDRYLRQRRMSGFDLTPDLVPYGRVTLRELPPGEAKMMEIRIISQRGVNSQQAAELVGKARAIGAKYTDDAGVQAALAEAEFDAGNHDAAIAAADKAIALDPRRTNAHVQKGFALFAKAEGAEDRDAAYREAVKALTALNKIEPDHPIPLIYYFRSFVERGLRPDDTARHALERAAQLSPFDQGLAMNTALMQADEGKIALAKRNLQPLAADPHGSALAEQAKAFIEMLDGVEEGTPWHPNMSAIRRVIEDSEAIDEDDPIKD